jgi:uncharacterized phiE125 gp8 family phage protein
MALNANALTDLATAKNYCKVPTTVTEEDSILELFINAASEDLERECDRMLKKQSNIIEYQHGRKQNIILLNEWPVLTINELWIDNDSNFTDPNDMVDSSDYRIADDLNSLLYKDYIFPSGYNNIKIDYDAGYDPIPSDLSHACLWTVFWYYRIREAADIGRVAKSKEGESVSWVQTAPLHVKDVIARYKRTEFKAGNAIIQNR